MLMFEQNRMKEGIVEPLTKQDPPEPNPVITLNGDYLVTLELGETYEDAGAVVDHGKLMVDMSLVDFKQTGTYRIIYRAGQTQTYRILHIVDTTKPVIVLNAPHENTVELGTMYREQGATATDAFGVELPVTIDSNVDSKRAGRYSVTYTATDASENTSVATRKITVSDTTPPTIHFAKSIKQHMELEVGTRHHIDPSEDVLPSESCDIMVTVVVNGKSHYSFRDKTTEIVGEEDGQTFRISYVAVDTAGLSSTAITRTVSYRDTQNPVIVLKGENPLYHEVNNPYTDAGATVIDNGSATLQVDATNVNSNEVGQYVVAYMASDGRNEATATRDVIVVDTVAPTVHIIGEMVVTHELGTPYVDKGATATDRTLNDTTVTTTNNVDIGTVGTYDVTYNASDKSNNSSTISRTVNVVQHLYWVTYEIEHENSKYQFHIQYDRRDKITWRVKSSMPLEHLGYTVKQMVFDFDLVSYLSSNDVDKIKTNVGSEQGIANFFLKYKGDAPDYNLWNSGRGEYELYIGFYHKGWIFTIAKTPSNNRENGFGLPFSKEGVISRLSTNATAPDLTQYTNLPVNQNRVKVAYQPSTPVI